MDLTRLGSVLTMRWGAATDTGPVRQQNQDSWLAEPPLFAVADGMGGHADGASASAAALDELAARLRPDALSGKAADLADLDRAIASAAARVAGLASPSAVLAEPGTTLTGVLVLDAPHGPHGLVFNIGDSRTYLVADGELRQLTHDHSLLQEVKDQAALWPPQEVEGQATTASDSESDLDVLEVLANVVTRALGAGGHGLPEADYTVTPLRQGDRLILCSDGVCGVVHDADLVRTVESAQHPQTAANALIDLAIAQGTTDNATAVVVEITSAGHMETTPPGAADREVRTARPAAVQTAPRRHQEGR